jgi:hypothetical protein
VAEVSARTYREAVERYRGVLDLLGPFRGPCGFCGYPDARHRQADAIAAEVAADPAGTGPEVAAAEYLPPDQGAFAVGLEIAVRVAVAVLAADERLHGLTTGRAAAIDREVWAVTKPPPGGTREE